MRNAFHLFKAKFPDEGFDDPEVLIKKIDIDGSGSIDIKEFIAATINISNVLKD